MLYWRAKRLLNKGRAALAAQDYDRAIAVAQKLHRLRNTGGFEIEARALWELDKRKEATEILERGVKIAPGLFVLWDYLASFYSDQGWYDQALEAYGKALECPDAEVPSTQYNIALVHQRSGRDDLCIRVLSSLDAKGHIMEDMVAATLAHSLSESGDPQRALETVQERLDDPGKENRFPMWLYTERAWARWRLGQKQAALQDALSAIEVDKTAKRAAFLIRELAGEKSPNAHAWRLMLEGVSPHY